MPRATQSKGITILTYFRTAPLDEANFVLEMVKGEMRQRNQPAEGTTVPATRKAAKVAKPVRKRAARTPKPAATTPALEFPAGPAQTDQEAAAAAQ